MRLTAIVTGMTLLAPCFAQAQSAYPSSSPGAPVANQALSDVLFAHPGSSRFSDSQIGTHADPTTAAALGEVLVVQPASATAMARSGLVSPAEAALDWRSRQTTVSTSPGVVDSVRVSVADGPRLPLSAPAAGAYNVSYTRGWPSAVMLRAGQFGMDVSPHAGFGVSNDGNSAEAGAMVRFTSLKDAIANRLQAMGVKNGSAYGDKGRWYLFAAVQGKAVGLNMQQDAAGLHRAGWSTDSSSALIGDGQIGVGWRKGSMEASFGYVHREIKVQNAPTGASDGLSDSLAAFSISFRPGW
jgi:hypothetical protein